MAQNRPAAGFTLIEIAIALTVVAITTTFAIASYRGHFVRADRVEAVHALLAAAAEQEKFHLAHGRYGDRLDAVAGSQPPGLPVASRTPRGRYRLAIEMADASAFRIVASTSSGSGDRLCARLFIDESGRRAAMDIEGRDSTVKCW
jgi:prepilin-type N-terminal cleavage/methylation domain-containing protein